MRVPANPDFPTFDNVFRVGFWTWASSSRAERKEWVRRRNEAGRLAGQNQMARARARVEAVKLSRNPGAIVPGVDPWGGAGMPPAAVVVRPRRERKGFLHWLADITMSIYLLGYLAAALLVIGFGVWFAIWMVSH